MPRRKVVRAELVSKCRERETRPEKIWGWVVAVSTVFVVMVFKVAGCQYDQEKRDWDRHQQEHRYGVPRDEKPQYTPKDLEDYYKKGGSP